MSGIATGRTPRTGAEWARDVERRLGQLENPRTQRVGPWVLSHRDGALIATRPGVGSDTVAGEVPAKYIDFGGTDVRTIRADNKATVAQAGAQLANTNIGTLLDGVLGTGHQMQDLVTFLTELLSAQSFQDLLDAIAHALGFEGPGHTIANIQTYIAGFWTGFSDMVTNSAAGSAAVLGSALQTAIGQAQTATNNFETIVENAVAGTVANVGTMLGNANTAAQSALGQINDATVNAFGGAATTATAFGNAVAAQFGGMVNSLFGVPTPAAVPAVVNRGLEAVKENIAAHSTQINALTNQMLGMYSGVGVSDLVDFANFADGPIPSMFTVSHSAFGAASIHNGVVAWDPDPDHPFNTGQTVTARYNVSESATDYQKISVVVPDLGPGGHFVIYGRANLSGSQRVQARIFQGDGLGIPDTCQIWRLGVSPTILASTPFLLQPGAEYSLFCGTSEGVRFFEVTCNGSLILPANDSLSLFGPSNRWWGFEQGAYKIDEENPDVVSVPPTIKSFSVADNTLGLLPGPAGTSYVSTSQATSSASYTDLATTGPEVTANVGASGAAMVFLSSHIGTSVNVKGSMSFAVSGATTIAANDNRRIAFQTPFGAGAGASASLGASFVVTGLIPGSNTFTAKYRADQFSPGFAGFENRRVEVVPL
ncbi:hypothetical protein MSIMFI_04912 [Mycobacterium simulans]|uniref:DUF7257 domain-containing protein n=1 Tax=Mycobacterium simulans TaxID=627089 RepID=UPI00174E695B|nr:hypothetical protein [Mycobacterium simulans]SON63382.1 hypothetical protein MSIMFI_04912 [Mycobacterium simulans]